MMNRENKIYQMLLIIAFLILILDIIMVITLQRVDRGIGRIEAVLEEYCILIEP